MKLLLFKTSFYCLLHLLLFIVVLNWSFIFRVLYTLRIFWNRCSLSLLVFLFRYENHELLLIHVVHHLLKCVWVILCHFLHELRQTANIYIKPRPSLCSLSSLCSSFSMFLLLLKLLNSSHDCFHVLRIDVVWAYRHSTRGLQILVRLLSVMVALLGYILTLRDFILPVLLNEIIGHTGYNSSYDNDCYYNHNYSSCWHSTLFR